MDAPFHGPDDERSNPDDGMPDVHPQDMHIDEVVATFQKCYWTHPEAVIEAWEPGVRYMDGLWPNRVGCTECGEMARVVLFEDDFGHEAV